MAEHFKNWINGAGFQSECQHELFSPENNETLFNLNTEHTTSTLISVYSVHPTLNQANVYKNTCVRYVLW